MSKWFKSLGMLKARARIYKFPSRTLFSPVSVKFATNLKIIRISSVVVANFFARTYGPRRRRPENLHVGISNFFLTSDLFTSTIDVDDVRINACHAITMLVTSNVFDVDRSSKRSHFTLLAHKVPLDFLDC